MKQDYAHLIVLLDGSGSMSGCWTDTIGSLENLFKEQKKEKGKLTLSLVIFDARYQRVYNVSDVKDIETLSKIYNLGGSTSLYDSFCKLVDEEGMSLSKLPESERPSKVLFVTLTDGYENSSREFKLSDAKKRVEHQNTKYNWDFMFLGADFDAKEITTSFGLSDAFAVNYCKTETTKTGNVLNKLVSEYRSKAPGTRLLAKDVQDMQTEVSS